MKRIFVAVNLPKEVKTKLENLEKEIQGLFPEEMGELGEGGKIVKWVPKDNLHITLLFIGSVKEEEVPRVGDILKKTAQGWQPFSLQLSKVCYGPPGTMPPRLIWAELEKSKDAECLADALKQKMTEAGILKRGGKRPFSGHITLGRVRAWQWKRIAREERPEIEKEILLNFEVKSIELMESVLKRTGAEYSILESIKLYEPSR